MESASTERSPSPSPTRVVAPAGPNPSIRPRTVNRYSAGKNRYSSANRAPSLTPVKLRVAPSDPTCTRAALGVRVQSDTSAVSAPPPVRRLLRRKQDARQDRHDEHQDNSENNASFHLASARLRV